MAAKAQKACNVTAEQDEDLAIMRDELFILCGKAAEGLPGPEIFRILKTISEEVYEAGIDRIFATAPIHNHDNLANAFDYTWLTMCLIALRKAKAS